MKWLLLFLVVLAGCSTPRPGDYFTAATVYVAQGQDSAARGRELAAEQTRAAMPTSTPQPTATPVPTETPLPTSTSTPEPTATATGTPTPQASATEPAQMVARVQVMATTGRDSANTRPAAVAQQGGDVIVLVVLAIAVIAFVLVAWPWIKRLMKW